MVLLCKRRSITVVFVPHLSSKNNKHPDLDRLTFNLGAASKATAGNNCPAHRWQIKGATQKTTNTSVKYDKNIHFVSGDFVDTDGRNVEFEEGRDNP